MRIVPSRTFPKHIKSASVDRIDAIAKGLRRKHVKVYRKASKGYAKRQVTILPSVKDVYIVNKYPHRLDHLM